MLSQVVRGEGSILIKHPSKSESDSPNKHSANAEQSLCNNAAYKTTAVLVCVQQAQLATTKHCTQMHVMILFSLAYIDAQYIGRQMQSPFDHVLPSEAVPFLQLPPAVMFCSLRLLSMSNMTNHNDDLDAKSLRKTLHPCPNAAEACSRPRTSDQSSPSMDDSSNSFT